MHVEISSDRQSITISTRPGVAAVITRSGLDKAITQFIGNQDDRAAVVAFLVDAFTPGKARRATEAPAASDRETAPQPTALDVERTVIDVLDRLSAGTSPLNGVPGQGPVSDDPVWREA